MQPYPSCTYVSISRDYQLALPRKEVEEVNNLRDRWRNLMDLADQVRDSLLFSKQQKPKGQKKSL
jgi:hypothetical protein